MNFKSKKETVAFFDMFAQTYPYTFQSLKNPRVYKYIEKKVQQVTRRHSLRGKLILDVGCGTGVFSLIFSNLGGVVVGFDLSSRMIHLANLSSKMSEVREHPNFLVADVDSLPFRDDLFDLAFANDFMHHLEDMETAIEMIARTVHPGGTVIDIEPNGSSPFGLLVSLLRETDRGIPSCNRINLRRVFSEHDLLDVKIRGFSFSHPIMPLGLLNFLEPIEAILERTFLEYLAGFLIIEAKRGKNSTGRESGHKR